MICAAALVFLGAGLAEEAAGGSCNTTSAHCYANHENIIAAHSNTGLTGCCDLCHATAKCASFSHWGGNNETGPANCFLFSTVSAPTRAKDCSSGTTGRAPSPAPPRPAPGPPPPPPPSRPSGKNFVLFVPGSVRIGLGCSVALYRPSSTLSQIH